jgi:hypothetical protein
MTDRDDDNAFDRLAGQPDEPTSDTGALVDAVRGKGTALDVGSMHLTGITNPSMRTVVRSDPLPWVVAAALGIAFLLVVFAWAMPMRSELGKVSGDLEEATRKLESKSAEVSRLEVERNDLEKGRAALAIENEQRALGVDQARRSDEEQDAAGKKGKLTAPKKPVKKTIKKPKKK